MGPGRFGAVCCAMATPFQEGGGLDTEGAARLARWLVEHGNDSLVLTGTTGESPVLSDGEKEELWRAVRAAVDVPLLMGTSTADTAHSVHLTRAAVDAGADGILAVTPYYNRPSQAGSRPTSVPSPPPPAASPSSSTTFPCAPGALPAPAPS